MRNITHIVVHCTATSQSATVSSIQRYWRTIMKWRQPGYHIIVTPGGAAIRLAEDTQTTNGVRGRSSDNTLIREVLGWEPSIPLKDGLTKTYAWIAGQMGFDIKG